MRDPTGVADALRVEPTVRAYKRFLSRTYGIVAPLERALETTPGLSRYVDMRRFNKRELLRRDLVALRMAAADVVALAQCPVPPFDDACTALGWAHCIERSTLSHTAVFGHFAAAIPGEVAFAGAYLKCYFGAVGEMWRAFGDALELVGPEGEQLALEGARAAQRVFTQWRRSANDSGSLPLITRDSDFETA